MTESEICIWNSNYNMGFVIPLGNGLSGIDSTHPHIVLGLKEYFLEFYI